MQPKYPHRLALATLSVVVLAACSDAVPTAPASVDADLSRANASPVAQQRLEALFQSLSPEIMALPGTVFADNDERIGKVVFGVEHAAAGRGVAQALARRGVARDDYSIEVTEPIRFAASLRDVHRPVFGGVQLHFSRYVCTLGFNVSGGNKNGQAFGRSFITNSHCTATQGGTEGTLYYQPSSSSSEVIAREVDDPQYVKDANCPKGKKCRHSDAARAEYTATASTLGKIGKTTGVNNQSLELGSTSFSITSQDNTTKNFAVGTVVNKVGRTTGWTQGAVQRTCVNTSVSGSTVHLYCQTFVNNPSATVVNGGDSGSGAFTITSGDNVKLVGILWGSSGSNTFIFSPLASIQQELGSLTTH